MKNRSAVSKCVAHVASRMGTAVWKTLRAGRPIAKFASLRVHDNAPGE